MWDGIVPSEPVDLPRALERLFAAAAPSPSPLPSSSPRLVVFGEQHHQPRVLDAQLAVLSSFVRHHTSSSQPSHLVMEHFSLLDQPMLDLHASRSISDAELIATYAASTEGFRIEHYLPLLHAARNLGVRVVGGFPPRPWAQLAYRTGLDAVMAEELKRQHRGDQLIPPFTDWDSARNVSYAHSTYLSSLIHPDAPPCFPPVDPPATPDQPYPTDRLGARAPQDRGFELAQTLKDAYFAHSITSLLAHGNVLAITGLGHCEYGLGALERTQETPLVILSKPQDTSVWRGASTEQSGPSLLPGTGDPWSHAASNAVVLYEWEE